MRVQLIKNWRILIRGTENTAEMISKIQKIRTVSIRGIPIKNPSN